MINKDELIYKLEDVIEYLKNKACLYLLSINKLTKYRTSSTYSTMLESDSPVHGHNLLYNS